MRENFKFKILNFKLPEGFTLIEMIVYVAIVAVLILTIAAFAVWAIQVGSKTKINYELADNARRAMEKMVYEIKKSKSIYAPASIFEINPGQLSLEQVTTSIPGETATFIDFFQCGNALCEKKEGQAPQALTNERVKLTSLKFFQLLNSTTTPSVQISLKLESAASSTRPEYAGSLELINTVTLRSY